MYSPRFRSLSGGSKPPLTTLVLAPDQPYSLLQVTAWSPADADSGQQPVVLRIGENDNAQQKVTVAIK